MHVFEKILKITEWYIKRMNFIVSELYLKQMNKEYEISNKTTSKLKVYSDKP